MRILLAYDGSDDAAVAARLVERASWPVRSSIEVVTVVEPELARLPVGPWPTPAAAGTIAAEDDLARVVAAKSALDDVADRLRVNWPDITTVVLRGEARQLLLTRIERDLPDLVVTGTRYLGSLRRTVLGSLSSALVDASPVPVLVARRDRVERVVVATDGSDIADQALATIARWPFLSTAEIRVASVAPDHPVPWPNEMIPGVPPGAVEDVRADSADLAEHERIATYAADCLAAAGLTARPQVLTGSPGAALTEFTRQWGADLVILGSHGRTGITRVVLGSVAREVLDNAPASVLIVRRHADPVRRRRPAQKVPLHSLAVH